MNSQFVRIIIALLTSFIMFAGCSEKNHDPKLSEPQKQGRLKALGNTICQQTTSGIMWQVEKSPLLSTWEDAKQYADSLDLGGNTDWRLPTTDELYIQHDIFEQKDNADCNMIRKGFYWCGESKKKASIGKWESYPLFGGDEYEFIKGKSGYVRAVRP